MLWPLSNGARANMLQPFRRRSLANTASSCYTLGLNLFGRYLISSEGYAKDSHVCRSLLDEYSYLSKLVAQFMVRKLERMRLGSTTFALGAKILLHLPHGFDLLLGFSW